MNDILSVFFTTTQQVLTLFILMGLGYVLGKTKIITREGSQGIVNLIMYVVTPAMMIYAFQRPYVAEDMKNFLLVGLAGALSIAFLAVLGRLVIRDKDPERSRTFQFALQFTNCSYMGYPILTALIGSTAIFFASAYMAVFCVVGWSWGVYLLTGDRRQLRLRPMLLNPGMIGAVIALGLYLLQITLPQIIMTPLTYIAEMNTPLPMVVVGYQLSHANFRRALSGVWSWITLVLSLIVSPLLTLAAVLVLGIDPMIALILVIIMATPPATVLSLFAQMFGRDTELSSSVVSVFTLASVVTMPLVIGLARVVIG